MNIDIEWLRNDSKIDYHEYRLIPTKDLLAFREPENFFVDKDGKPNIHGEYDTRLYYYIPKIIYDELQSIFIAYPIPSELQQNLIWLFLSCVFTTRDLKKHKEELPEISKEFEEYIRIIDFLERLPFQGIEIAEMSFVYYEENNQKQIRESKNLNIKNVKSLQLITKSLINYKVANKLTSTPSDYKLLKLINGAKQKSPFKNVLTEYQVKYTRQALAYISNEEKSNNTKSKSKGISQSDKLKIIAKLMRLADLLPKGEEYDDDKLLDKMKKKLRAKIKTSKTGKNDF